MTGIYRSANINKHDFRLPPGMPRSPSTLGPESVGSRQPHVAQTIHEMLSKKVAATQSLADLAAVRIPPQFTTLKGHTQEKQRAEINALDFNSNYFVSRSSSYVNLGVTNDLGVRRNPVKEKGKLFMTTYKDHSDAERVANAHRAHPLMSGNVRESLSNNSKSPSLDRMLELGFRKEAINSKLRSPWN